MKFKNLLLTTVLFFGVVLKSNAQADWNTAGNVGTPTSFIGTTNNSPIIFRNNNVFSGSLGAGITSFGYDSMQFDQAGSTAFGINALHSNLANVIGMPPGGYNSAFGTSALASNTHGTANTAVGYQSITANVLGQQNTALGYQSLFRNLSDQNTAIGLRTLYSNTNGAGNTAVGVNAMRDGISGSNNTAIGNMALIKTIGNGNVGIGAGYVLNTGDYNILIGSESAKFLSAGTSNTFVGFYSGGDSVSSTANSFFGPSSGRGITTGSYNTFLGNVVVPITTAATAISAGNNTSRTIILADGDNAQRLYIHNNGFTGIGLGNNVIPKNTVEIKAVPGSPSPSGTGVSGLRLASLPNGNFNTLTTNATNKVLSVNKLGDVILVDDATGGLTSTCSTANFVPVNSTTTGVLACSQIYDNGTSVGIGTTGPFNYTWTGGLVGTTFPAASGVLKLDVNGVTRGLAFMATSDKKFKKDIKPIENALDKVMSLDGKTYNWRKEEFKDINFTDELQYGLIAQEVQQIIPSLVIKTEKGDLAMNYMGLIPILIEAMKEQQAQITELKNTISENFKSQNDDVIKLENTKIINVSPNPSSDVITVSLNIEKTVQNAKLQVYDLNGILLSSLNVNERENNVTKTLQKDNFGKGIYIVSLVINGKSIDTKRIIFN